MDGGKLLSKIPFWSVPAHIFEPIGWNNITFGSQGISHSFSDFGLGMAPFDLELLLGGGGGGGASAGRPFSFELKL